LKKFFQWAVFKSHRNQAIGVICLLWAGGIFAQQQRMQDSMNVNESPIIDYNDYFTTRLSFSDNFNAFKLRNPADGSQFLISPNRQINANLTLAYRFLEIDVSYTPDFLRFNEDDEIKGKTKFVNFGTRFYLGRFMQNFQYRTTKGFFVEDLDFPDTDLFVASDLRVGKLGGSTAYILNPDFSFRAIFKQNEWQMKSAGSFVPILSYYWTRISDKEPETDTFFDITLGPSYYYNLIVKKDFLVSAGAHIGLGYNSTKLSFSDGMPSQRFEGLTYTTELKVAFGYNTTHFFTGMNITFDAFYHNDEPDFRIDDRQRFFEFFLGYRFNAPKILIKGADYIEKKLTKKKKSD